jgi:hypothetical protein
VRIGAVIVTFNSASHLQRCLDSCARFLQSFPAGAVVVDNASSDESVAVARRYPFVTLIANRENRGFGAAVNQGFQHLADAEAVLLLNPDAILQTSLDGMAGELAAHPRAGAAGGRLVDSNGRFQHGFCVRRFPSPSVLFFEVLGLNRVWYSNPVNRRYRCLDFDPARPAEVDQPAGAFVLIRRSAWTQVDGFDEQFLPVWFEDVDFLLRAARSGWIARYTPLTSAVHDGGHSVSLLSWSPKQVSWYGSLLRFTALHFRRLERVAVGSAVLVGIGVRSLLAIPKQGWKPAATAFWNVARLAASCMFQEKQRGAEQTARNVH